MGSKTTPASTVIGLHSCCPVVIGTENHVELSLIGPTAVVSTSPAVAGTWVSDGFVMAGAAVVVTVEYCIVAGDMVIIAGAVVVSVSFVAAAGESLRLLPPWHFFAEADKWKTN